MKQNNSPLPHRKTISLSEKTSGIYGPFPELITSPGIEKIVVFPVEPRAARRMTRKQLQMAMAPEHKLPPKSRAVAQGIKAYMGYKATLQALAMQGRFTMPVANFSMNFFIETAKEERWEMPHLDTPDLDNMIKALKDALCKDDRRIYRYRDSGKFWTKPGDGRIEITIYRNTVWPSMLPKS